MNWKKINVIRTLLVKTNHGLFLKYIFFFFTSEISEHLFARCFDILKSNVNTIIIIIICIFFFMKNVKYYIIKRPTCSNAKTRQNHVRAVFLIRTVIVRLLSPELFSYICMHASSGPGDMQIPFAKTTLNNKLK